MKYWFLAVLLCLLATPLAAQTPVRPQGPTIRPGTIQLDTAAIRRDTATAASDTAAGDPRTRVRAGIPVDMSSVAPMSTSLPGNFTQRTPGAVSRLRITMHTGGDDLRQQSHVAVFFITRDGRRIESKPINCNPRYCEGMANNTRRTFEWDLQADQVVRPADIHRFGVSFTSNPRMLLMETHDNWNLDRIEVEYFVAVGDAAKAAGVYPLLDRAGRPLMRFHTREQWESEPLRLQ